MPKPREYRQANAHKPVYKQRATIIRALPTHPHGTDLMRSPVTAGIESFGDFTLSAAAVAADQTRQPLTSIAALSFPAEHAASLAMLPGDERRPVPDTSIYPFRAIACLRIWVSGFQPFIATGWFIGPQAIATAGHAVFVRSANPAVRNRWVDRIDVIPGMNDGKTPSFGGATSTQFTSTVGWTQNGLREYDYGVIFINEALGNTVGRFLFEAYDDSHLMGAAVNLIGYPETSPDPSVPNGVQWAGARQILSLDPAFVYYGLHTSSGQSGAPVYINVGGTPHVAAIHAYATPKGNMGVRFTPETCQNLTLWARHGLVGGE